MGIGVRLEDNNLSSPRSLRCPHFNPYLSNASSEPNPATVREIARTYIVTRRDGSTALDAGWRGWAVDPRATD